MNKATRLKIFGFLLIPFLVFIVIFFFLYPYLKTDTYQDIMKANQLEYGAFVDDSTYVMRDSLIILSDSLWIQDSLYVNSPEYLRGENERLQIKLDSMRISLNTLEADRNKVREELEAIQNSTLSSEEFIARVKSLYNLERDELAPILDKMTEKQLIRLYNEGSSMQREKLLRSLNSEKAANLLTEVML